MEQAAIDDVETTHSRRRLLGHAIGGVGFFALVGSSTLIGRRVTAQGDDDDHDDDDNSGHGSDDDNGHNSDDDDGGGSDDDAPVITGDIPAGSIEIRIVDDDADGFSPGDLTVDAGQSVTFVNADHHPHTATGAGFDTGTIQPGETATVVFDAPGDFAYSCRIHPVMTGWVRVRAVDGATPAPAADDPTGAFTVTLTPAPDAGLAPQEALVTFHADGTLEATYTTAGDAQGDFPFALGPAHGTWSADGAGRFRAITIAFLLDGDQRFAGTLTIREEAQLDATGDAYAGTFTFEATGADQGAIASGDGTTEGQRVRDEVEPLPRRASPAPEPGAADATTIAIVDFAFDPPALDIATGTTVTWINQGAAPHTATAEDGSFDTGQLDAGQVGSHTFDQPGTFTYRCAFHPEMRGTVVVS
jgi:plastocyanin